ncbi:MULTISPECIES: hypothetical protein [Streptomyces]|uniref:hypothetical protein n=1 Tax=Streptomyces TaxID=1883 RepID=UPI00073DBF42|nr:hypothetical protein [Streptomyces sp. EAS-AB2608]MYU26627.1 hypothetical protein [Streptomyces sp. SID7810]BCM65635.1 hypothetical protein EASAB2608_00969 [Streptomyces sp. EAS-AB2608]CUW25443.1 hypothetical protein TUE45_00153 [Streptomyces reticuli]
MPFHVNLTASKRPGECKAVGTGSVKHVINASEAKAFGLDQTDRIKAVIGKAVGKNPDEYWLKGPTPEGAANGADPEYGDVYTRFGWDPVTATLIVKNARLLEVTTKPVIAHHVEWINHTDHAASYSANMIIEKTDTCSSTWSWTDKFSVGQKITYKVSVKAEAPVGEVGGELGGETSFGFEHAWGEAKTKSHTVRVGVSDMVKSNVPKHSAETAYLFSTLGSAKFRITYEATLSGWLAFQHRDWYTASDGSARYRAHKVDMVLRNAGLPTSLTVHQDVTVGFYSDASVQLYPGRYNPNKKPGGVPR